MSQLKPPSSHQHTSPPEPEVLFAAVKKVTALTPTEQADMKTAFFASLDATPVVSPWSVLFARTAFAVVAVIIVFTGVTGASVTSQPGDPLYYTKVSVYEEMVELTKLSSLDRAAYTVDRLQLRLQELRAISDASPLTTEEQQQVEELIQNHVSELGRLLEDREDVIAEEEKVTIALEALESHVSFRKSAAQEGAAVATSTAVALEAIVLVTVADLVTDVSLEEANELLDERLSEVSTNLTTYASTSEIVDNASVILDAIDVHVLEGDLGGALIDVVDLQTSLEYEATSESRDLESSLEEDSN